MMPRLRAWSVGAGGGGSEHSGPQVFDPGRGGLLRIRTSILSELV